MVRLAGFEPASFRRQILSLLCMPFHHSRPPHHYSTVSRFAQVRRPAGRFNRRYSAMKGMDSSISARSSRKVSFIREQRLPSMSSGGSSMYLSEESDWIMPSRFQQ